MSSLSLYLPPFTSDYAGVCSALFDLDCMIAINDASCCTSNYVNYDEPRWSEAKKTTLCTSLRTVDAIFGTDEKVISQITEAAASIAPDFVVVLGSPVPAIIGTDTKGMAIETEALTGIPTLGIDTTGFPYYPAGIRAAFSQLIKRFGPKAGGDSALDEREKRAVNIIGMTPIDYGTGSYAALKALLEDNGFGVNATLGMGSSLGSIARIDQALCNIVVSYSGLEAARELRNRFGTPYVVSAFTGTGESARTIDAVRRLSASGDEDDPASGSYAADAEGSSSPESGVLIIGDQVIANSLRSAMRAAGCARRIAAASFFGIDGELAEAGDFAIGSEPALIKHMRSHRYDLVIGDPLLARVPEIGSGRLAALPHPAVSSRLHWSDVPVFPSSALDDLVAEALGRLS